MGLGSRNPAIVGSAEEVADDLIAGVEETDIDGFNLSRIVTPESLEDFVDLVVPILQERGAYKRDYLPRHLAREAVRPVAAAAIHHPVGAYRSRHLQQEIQLKFGEQRRDADQRQLSFGSRSCKVRKVRSERPRPSGEAAMRRIPSCASARPTWVCTLFDTGSPALGVWK